MDENELEPEIRPEPGNELEISEPGNKSEPDFKPVRDMVCSCMDCGRDFTITEGEQRFFASRNLNLPRRCVNCRRLRKERENAEKGNQNVIDR
jgi:hypothetical protein